jgi:GTP cyclohydrolase I
MDHSVREAFAESGVRALLEALGHDPSREGIKDTPRRVVKALIEMTSGEREDPADHLKVMFDGEHYDETVALAGIPFTSLCEHHLLPFVGFAGVAYLPSDGRVVGLSKLARVVDVFARRLQLQERLTAQIADAVEQHLRPKGVAVVVEAEHACMACRGIRKTGAVMRTVIVRGVYRDKAEARDEVLQALRRP